MFGFDDFAVWFAWYFVTNLATHPSAQRAMEQAQAAMVSDAPTVQADDPQRLLDWLHDAPPPVFAPDSGK